MRVPANLVEKILDSASAEAHEETRAPSRTRLEELVSAFKRAHELRMIPWKVVSLRGRKSRAVRDVIVTNERRTGKGGEYALCVVPYTEIEKRNARRRFTFETEINGEDGKPSGDMKLNIMPIPLGAHLQWVRSDRIKDAA